MPSSALAATHTPLPFQIPEIPLDAIKPGLSAKITYEGPVDHPTKATTQLHGQVRRQESKGTRRRTKAQRRRLVRAAVLLRTAKAS